MPSLLTKLDAWLRPLRPQRAAPSATLLQDDDPQRYLDPAALSRLTLTPMLIKRVVEGYIHGLHRSPFHGFSVEFADHREYVPGDDLKYLDWPVYARTDHYYIRRYEQETNVRTHILLDCSASMAYGTGRLTKWDYACFLSSCLCYLMIKQHDAAGLALFGTAPGALVPPRSNGSQLRRIMSLMMQTAPGGGSNLAGSLRAMVQRIPRRSLVVVISDLIDDPQQTLSALRLLSARRHDVIVFHVADVAEAEFTFDGPTLLRDMETGEEMEVDPSAVRREYLEQFEQTQQFYRRGLNEVGIDYEAITTSTRYDHALSAYLRRRVGMGV